MDRKHPLASAKRAARAGWPGGSSSDAADARAEQVRNRVRLTIEITARAGSTAGA